MTEIATVVSHTKNLTVLSCTSEGCSSCAGNSFCNVKAHTYTALNPDKLEIESGDEVEVFLPPGKTIFSGFLVLIFPLILFIAGFLLTGAVIKDAGEGIQTLGGFIGLTAGFGLGFLFGRLKKRQYMPIIRKKVLS